MDLGGRPRGRGAFVLVSEPARASAPGVVRADLDGRPRFLATAGVARTVEASEISARDEDGTERRAAGVGAPTVDESETLPALRRGELMRRRGSMAEFEMSEAA